MKETGEIDFGNLLLHSTLFTKKRLQHRCFLVNVKFSRAPILKNICKRLLLYISK